ncbi:MAG: hypothetical protein ABIP75_05600 [Pyrinomonadaceae bacterium]
MHYRLCDYVIDSELPLAELNSATAPGRETITLRRGPAVTPNQSDHEWFHEWRYPDGELWTSFAYTPGGYVCRFADIADFHLNDTGNTIVCRPVAGIPDGTLSHIFLNQVMPIVFSATGDRLILHSSAVAIGGQVIGFLGPTGQGKSTLAGSFCGAGFPLLTDDFLVLEDAGGGVQAVPTFGGLRLWDDVISAVAETAINAPDVAHYTDKKRICLGEYDLPFCNEPLPMKRFYLLEDDDSAAGSDVMFRRVSAREAVMEFTRYSFYLDLSAGAVRQTEFERVGQLAAAVPVYRLSYPRDLRQLETVREKILRHLDGEAVSN